MNKEQMEIRRIENAFKKEKVIEDLKAKHGITGTALQQKTKLNQKKLLVNLE